MKTSQCQIPNPILPYSEIYSKMTDRGKIRLKSEVGSERRAKRYSFATVQDKNNVDVMKAEFKKKFPLYNTDKPSEPISKGDSLFVMTKPNSARCQSASMIKVNGTLETLKLCQRKLELEKTHKQSLKRWKGIRSLRIRKEKEDRKQIQQEIKQRYRQSCMQSLLKKKALDEERRLEHEMNQQWIRTIRADKSNTVVLLPKSKSKGRQAFRQIPTLNHESKPYAVRYASENRPRPSSASQSKTHKKVTFG